MGLNINDAIGLHARALDLRLQRSEILAANLANESTPGFAARDIDFAGEMRRFSDAESLGVGAASDFAGLGQAGAPELKYRVPMQGSLDGNTVELNLEQAEFSRNSMDFQQSLTFLNAKFRGLKQAIEGR